LVHRKGFLIASCVLKLASEAFLSEVQVTAKIQMTNQEFFKNHFLKPFLKIPIASSI